MLEETKRGRGLSRELSNEADSRVRKMLLVEGDPSVPKGTEERQRQRRETQNSRAVFGPEDLKQQSNHQPYPPTQGYWWEIAEGRPNSLSVLLEVPRLLGDLLPSLPTTSSLMTNRHLILNSV